MQESNGKKQSGNRKLKKRQKQSKGLTKLNLDYYWAYAVKPHSQKMNLEYIIYFAEKMVPALTIYVFLAQPKAEDSQPTLPRQILNACNIKEQMQK